MNSKGKQKLIESLAEKIEEWEREIDPNSYDETDIGFVGKKTWILMATVAVTALELNAEAQKVAIKDGFLAER